MNFPKMAVALRDLGEEVRDAVRSELASRSPKDRTKIHGKAASDVIYQIDNDAERIILKTLEIKAEALGGIVLVAEGIDESNTHVIPSEMPADQAAWRVLIDPIDGTRGLMVGKRSAFFLAGAAPNNGSATKLLDIQAAAMVEIPTDRALFSDALWAVKGQGVLGLTRNLLDHSSKDLLTSPSRESTIHGGFAQISRFFHPGKDVLASIEEELISSLYPNAQDGEIIAFEDQYICSGGQLYELAMGRDRFTADLRNSLYAKERREERRIGHACHPYDLAAHLVGSEAGVILTNALGQPLDAPLDTTTDMDWVGYANRSIQDQVAPILIRLVKKHLY